MKVILLDDVAKVGRRGEVREVSDGYARNFLIPKKLALGASAGNLKNLDHIKTQQDAKAARVKSDAEALGGRIEALVYEERRQASEEGKLFGSVTAQDVVDFLARNGIEIHGQLARVGDGAACESLTCGDRSHCSRAPTTRHQIQRVHGIRYHSQSKPRTHLAVASYLNCQPAVSKKSPLRDGCSTSPGVAEDDAVSTFV